MKRLLLASLLLLGCEDSASTYHEYGRANFTVVILGVNEKVNRTYLHTLENDGHPEITGIWGRVGDTLRVDGYFILRRQEE